MLQIILLLLKIAGILLAVFLGIVICAIILILFVPIRYRIKGEGDIHGDVKLQADIKIHWLLHFVSVRVNYPESNSFCVRLLGIPIYDPTKKKKKKTSARKQKRSAAKAKERLSRTDTEKESTEEDLTEEISAEIQTPDHADSVKESKQEKRPIDSNDTKESEENDLPPKQSRASAWFKRRIRIFRNIRYTIKRICDRIRNIFHHIRYYTEFIQSKPFTDAYELAKEQLRIVLLALRPRTCRIDLLIGTGDPAGTGQVLAVYGMLYPLFGNHVNLTPDFDHLAVKGCFFIRGGVMSFTLLWAAFKIYKDKNIKKVLNMLHKEEA